MSVRLEWSLANSTSSTVHHRGDRLGDGQKVTEEIAVVVGSQVIEGTIDDVRDRLLEALLLVHVAGARKRRGTRGNSRRP